MEQARICCFGSNVVLPSTTCLPGQVLSLPVSWHFEPPSACSSLSRPSGSCCSLPRTVARSCWWQAGVLCPWWGPECRSLEGDGRVHSTRGASAAHGSGVTAMGWQCHKASLGCLLVEVSCPATRRNQVSPGAEAAMTLGPASPWLLEQWACVKGRQTSQPPVGHGTQRGHARAQQEGDRPSVSQEGRTITRNWPRQAFTWGFQPPGLWESEVLSFKSPPPPSLILCYASPSWIRQDHDGQMHVWSHTGHWLRLTSLRGKFWVNWGRMKDTWAWDGMKPDWNGKVKTMNRKHTDYKTICISIISCEKLQKCVCVCVSGKLYTEVL